MVEGLTARLRSVIRLNSPVTMIEHGARSVRVTTPNGVWVADRVIVAMAPTMTQQILFDPVLPVMRNQSVQRMGWAPRSRHSPSTTHRSGASAT
jgi:monoamine oxidase